MSHPLVLLKKIVLATPGLDESPLTLQVQAYERKQKSMFPPVRSENEYYDTKNRKSGRASVTIDHKHLGTLDSRLQSAVFQAVRSEDLVLTHSSKVEFGISTTMERVFWPAADLDPATTLDDLPNAAESIRDALRRTSEMFADLPIAFYETGNGFHAYAGLFLPIFLRDTYFRGLSHCSLVDQKWVKVARTDLKDGGVLRWGPGSESRVTPKLVHIHD